LAWLGPDRPALKTPLGRAVHAVADVFIRTGERTLLGYLIQPLTDSFDMAWRER
jgi:hypothetical protein